MMSIIFCEFSRQGSYPDAEEDGKSCVILRAGFQKHIFGEFPDREIMWQLMLKSFSHDNKLRVISADKLTGFQ